MCNLRGPLKLINPDFIDELVFAFVNKLDERFVKIT